MVFVTVTDGTNGAMVALSVVVKELLRILSPSDGTLFRLVKEDRSAAVVQVEVLVAQSQTEISVTLDLRLDDAKLSPALVSGD